MQTEPDQSSVPSMSVANSPNTMDIDSNTKNENVICLVFYRYIHIYQS